MTPALAMLALAALRRQLLRCEPCDARSRGAALVEMRELEHIANRPEAEKWGIG